MSTYVAEYVVLLHPTDEEKAKGKRAAPIASTGPSLFVSAQHAHDEAIAELVLNTEHADKLDRVEVLVRPFCAGA